MDGQQNINKDYTILHDANSLQVYIYMILYWHVSFLSCISPVFSVC